MVEMQFAEFVTAAYDQIATVAAKKFFLAEGPTPVPMVVRMPYGSNLCGDSYMPAAGPPRSQSPEAWFCHLAGVKFVMRSSSAIEGVCARDMPVPPGMRAKGRPASRALLKRTVFSSNNAPAALASAPSRSRCAAAHSGNQQSWAA